MDLNVSLLNNEIETGLSEMLDKYMDYVQNTLLQEDFINNMRMIKVYN